MKTDQKLWTREELILAINLYCKLPFGKIHQRNPEINRLALLINRTPGSVAYKLVNFASLDPSLQARGIVGAYNTSKLDKLIWNEFYQNWDVLAYESEKLLSNLSKVSIEKLNNIAEEELPKEGITRERLVKTRVNQNFFRRSILSSYNFTCCITGIKNPELLIAGHISRWSEDEANRMNPHNGILLNALHDKAFESGLITITPDYIIKVSSRIKDSEVKEAQELFYRYDNKEIILPSRFLPDKEFLKNHNCSRFQP